MSSLWLCRFTTIFAVLSAVQAAPLTFFGEDLNGNPNSRIAFPKAAAARANFVSQLPGIATDNFEEFSNGASLPLSLTFSGAASATLNGAAGFIQTLASGTNGNGRFPTSGNNYLDSDAASLILTFVSPVTAFGFYGTDIGDFGGQLSLMFTGTRTVSIPVPHSLGTGTGSPQDGSVLFFGYIDTANPFTSVQFLNTAASDSFGFDDAVIGVRQVTLTPEPDSCLLFGAGLLGFVILRHQIRNVRKGTL